MTKSTCFPISTEQRIKTLFICTVHNSNAGKKDCSGMWCDVDFLDVKQQQFVLVTLPGFIIVTKHQFVIVKSLEFVIVT